MLSVGHVNTNNHCVTFQAKGPRVSSKAAQKIIKRIQNPKYQYFQKEFKKLYKELFTAYENLNNGNISDNDVNRILNESMNKIFFLNKIYVK